MNCRINGLCLTLVLAGSLSRKLSPFQFFEGLIGLGTKPPPPSQLRLETLRARLNPIFTIGLTM